MVIDCPLLFYNIVIIIYCIVATVYFNQSTFTANEGDGTVQIILILSKAKFIDVTILIRGNDNTATGEQININC